MPVTGGIARSPEIVASTALAHSGLRTINGRESILEYGQEQRSTRIAIATGMAIAVYGMEATLLGTLLPGFSRVLTPAQGGTIAAAQSLGLIFGSLVTGPVIDRTGAKAGIACGLVLIALALSALPGAHTYIPILLVMSGLGLGGGVISTGTNTMASVIGGARRSSMLNLLNVFFGVGGLITPALGAWLSSRTLCFLIVLFASATLGFLALTAVPSRTRRSGEGTAPNGMLLRPVFVLLCLFLSLYVATEVGIWNWLAAYLAGKGIAQSAALRVLSFGFAAGIIAGRLGAAKILARFDPVRLTLICAALMALSTSAILLAHGVGLASVAVFSAGVAMAPVYPTTIGMIGGEFPRGTATAIGIAVTLGWVGVAGSSKLIGSIAGDDPHRLGTALLVLPAMSLLMVGVNLIFSRLPRVSAIAANPE
jgi:fucose permease